MMGRILGVDVGRVSRRCGMIRVLTRAGIDRDGPFVVDSHAPFEPVRVSNESRFRRGFVMLGPRPRSLEERFWPKVDKGGGGGCWEWLAVKSEGYGKLWSVAAHRMLYAHRVSYEMHFGRPIPADMTIDHLCRNRGCVNPLHMEVVSSAENTTRGNFYQRGISKGKGIPHVHCRGEVHPRAKLHAGQVIEIRRRGAEGESHLRLAAEYGVSPRNVRSIVLREIWRHV